MDIEDVTINEEGKWNAHDNLIHSKHGKREAPHVEPHPAQNEHDRRSCHCHVCLYLCLSVGVRVFRTCEHWCSSNFLVLQMRDTREF